MNIKHDPSMFKNGLNAVGGFHFHWLRIRLWNGECIQVRVWQKLKVHSFSLWQMHREIHVQQMPGQSHKLPILFQHFRLSDSDCYVFQTNDLKARHKCLLNFIWLISLKSIFVTCKDSACCSPRQNYAELIWRRNGACWEYGLLDSNVTETQ